MRKIIGLLLCIFPLVTANSYSQQISRPEQTFSTIFRSSADLSSYFVINNPAFASFDTDLEALYIRSTVNNSEGTFKPFIIPQRTTRYQQSVSGKKKLNDSQVFKGSFGFQKQIRDDWNWIFSRDLRLGMPFLLGDSTSGKTHYNGIAMKAWYAKEFSKKFLTGLELDYYVDEGLKEISPKPTSKHRDILFRAGLGYLVNKNLAIGMVFNLVDNYEEIFYREDKASLYQETILFKFRGYDYPLVFNKKTESRFSYFDEFASYFSLTYQSKEKIYLSAYTGGSIQQEEFKDDATHPQPEGYWKNTISEADIQSSIALSNSISIGTNYHYQNESMWARNPIYNVLMSEVDLPRHSFTTGIEYALTPAFRFGVETGTTLEKIDYHDYYSDLNWTVDRSKLLSQIGVDIDWSSSFKTFISYGFGKLTTSSKSFSGEMHSPVSEFRIRDILYYLTDSVEHQANLKLAIDSGFLGLIQIYANYRKMCARDTMTFSNENFNEINVTIEFLVNVY